MALVDAWLSISSVRSFNTSITNARSLCTRAHVTVCVWGEAKMEALVNVAFITHLLLDTCIRMMLLLPPPPPSPSQRTKKKHEMLLLIVNAIYMDNGRGTFSERDMDMCVCVCVWKENMAGRGIGRSSVGRYSYQSINTVQRGRNRMEIMC